MQCKQARRCRGFIFPHISKVLPVAFCLSLSTFFLSINHTRCNTMYIGAEVILIGAWHQGHRSVPQWWLKPSTLGLLGLELSHSADKHAAISGHSSSNNSLWLVSKCCLLPVKHLVLWPRGHYLNPIDYRWVSDQSRNMIGLEGSHILLFDWHFVWSAPFAEIVEQVSRGLYPSKCS